MPLWVDDVDDDETHTFCSFSPAAVIDGMDWLTASAVWASIRNVVRLATPTP